MRKNLLLLFFTILIVFGIVEAGYRVLDPFPHEFAWEVNDTEFGSAYQYDPLLGWAGIPNAAETDILPEGRYHIKNNSLGFRDIEHNQNTPSQKRIIFLGDSFTQGYLVEFDDMFVNLLREKFPQYEIFNLAQRGYGTDQSSMAFKRFKDKGQLKTVVLMFSENDIDDNYMPMRYRKFKPRFKLQEGHLIITNVPIPRLQQWDVYRTRKPLNKTKLKFADRIKEYIFHYSHFIHDASFRIDNYSHPDKYNDEDTKGAQESAQMKFYKVLLTQKIIETLNEEVNKNGGELLVAAIPSKKQFIKNLNYEPYQLPIQAACRELNVGYLDLAPYFQKAKLRAYNRIDGHWTKYGHRIAAEAIFNYLSSKN